MTTLNPTDHDFAELAANVSPDVLALNPSLTQDAQQASAASSRPEPRPARATGRGARPGGKRLRNMTNDEWQARLMSEAKLHANIVELAHALGRLVAHFRPAWTTKGYRTPVSADGAGFTDFVIPVTRDVLFRETKTQDGQLSDGQKAWRDALLAAGANWGVWRPSDWLNGTIEKELRG